jgi:SAM-dependent methyltransferase
MPDYITDPEFPHLGGNVVGGDDCSYVPDVWEWLVAEFLPTSILDVGCGTGIAVEYFHNMGLDAVGFDGLPQNVLNAVVPIKLHDLNEGPFISRKYDMVWCCELVEHVEEQYLPHILKTFKLGEIIAMTHGLPGQGGWHHVNEQLPAYWIDKMQEAGFEYLEELSECSKREIRAHGQWIGWWSRGLIFRNPSF